jgi:dimeric dUTPase (all-alpha-NTP-PPase superfamily)
VNIMSIDEKAVRQLNLPADKLEAIFEMQKKLSAILKSDFTTRFPTQEQQVHALMDAAIHEACEVQDECAWKWWKKTQVFDKEKAKKELIDLWHFVVAASLYLEMTPQDILGGYKEKHIINVQRQESGY